MENATKDQIAAIMLTRGTPNQQKEALEYCGLKFDPITHNAIPSSEILLLNSHIATLQKEITQKEMELLSAKNLLFSLKKRSRDLQVCNFVAADKVTHIRPGHREVIPNSHPITKGKGLDIAKYLENLPAAERLAMFAELINMK